MKPGGTLPIVDAHVHLYDRKANRYAIFERHDATFEALVGDYALLPRTYLLDDYLEATASHRVEGIVWHEFIAADAEAEAAWGDRLAAGSPVPMSVVALVDFADPDLPRRLEFYGGLQHLAGVRQHLGWDEATPLRRMAPRPDLMIDPAWRAGLARMKGSDLRCGLECFSPQLPALLEIVRSHPDIGFTVAVMGWPIELGPEGLARWRSDTAALARCANARVSISAVECIFGMHWTEARIRPWILSLVESFGPHRCMLGSHLPIDGLSYGFDALYGAYDSILSGYSEAERRSIFGGTAAEWFRMPLSTPAVGEYT